MKTNTISKEMREVNVLRYGATKVYVDNGETLRMQVKYNLMMNVRTAFIPGV